MYEAQILKSGGVGILPTDTLYGIVAAATNGEAVRRVYSLKKRDATKPSIILIASVEDVLAFGVELTSERREVLARYWPGPTSIVLSCGDMAPEYLHCGNHTLAFRLPADEELRTFLRESGPLIAPSANPEGLPPATTIDEAKKYFYGTVDFCIDGGVHAGEPSTLIALDQNNAVTVLREGR
jgi:L-threonylcarbamoyladenylate synthase